MALPGIVTRLIRPPNECRLINLGRRDIRSSDLRLYESNVQHGGPSFRSGCRQENSRAGDDRRSGLTGEGALCRGRRGGDGCGGGGVFAGESSDSRGVAAGWESELRLDPNTVPPEVLTALPHVGASLVDRWIKAREERPFDSLEDARVRVRGLGAATLGQIAP